MKLFAFSMAVVSWLGFMLYLARLKGKKPMVAEREPQASTAGLGKDGVQIEQRNGVLTIHINPELLSQKIQLKMDSKKEEVTVQVLQGETSHQEDPTPMEDVDENEILTPTDEINDLLLAQISDAAREGKAKFGDD